MGSSHEFKSNCSLERPGRGFEATLRTLVLGFVVVRFLAVTVGLALALVVVRFLAVALGLAFAFVVLRFLAVTVGLALALVVVRFLAVALGLAFALVVGRFLAVALGLAFALVVVLLREALAFEPVLLFAVLLVVRPAIFVILRKKIRISLFRFL